MQQRKLTAIVMSLLSIAILLAACTPAAVTPSTSVNTSSEATDFNGAKLNLNTVTGDELLATIPGFPNRMVREFQEYRPYLSIRQFRREIGKYVDDAQVADYEKYVYVPIAYNDSDAETLQQIPGLDASEADMLISDRPYASIDAFLSTLGGYVSPVELEIGKTYLDEGA